MYLTNFFKYTFSSYSVTITQDSSGAMAKTYAITNTNIQCALQPNPYDINTEFERYKSQRKTSILFNNLTAFQTIKEEDALKILDSDGNSYDYRVVGKTDYANQQRVFEIIAQQLINDGSTLP